MGNKYQRKKEHFPRPIAEISPKTQESLEEVSDDKVQRLIHQLKEHQTELEMQNEQLRQAQMELEESRNKYAELYDFAPVGYFTLNEKCIILGANLTGASLLGIEREKLIKGAFIQYVSKESLDLFYYYRKRLLEPKTRQAGELKMLRKDGTPFYAHLEGRGIFDREGNFSNFIITILDITQQKRLEEELRESEKQYKDLFQNSPTGIYRTTPDGRILMANPALIRMLGYSSFDDLAAHNLEKEGGFQPVHYRKHFKELLDQKDEVIGLESQWVKLDGTFIFIRENARAIRGEDGAVLYYEGTVEDITVRRQTEEALRENLAQLSKKNRYEAIISTVTRSVHHSINLPEVLENAVEVMSKNIDVAENVSIYLVEGKEAILRAYRGYPDWFVKRVRRIPYPKGATWRTIIDGIPRYCSDVDKDIHIGPAGRQLGTKSYLSMPIRSEGRTVGCIKIDSFKKNAFDDEELKLLGIVAQQIDVAINNAQQAEALRRSEELYRKAKEELEVKVKDLEILTSLIQAVHKSSNLEEVYNVALNSVTELENVDIAMIYLVDEEKCDAVIKAHRNLPEGYIKRAGIIPHPKGLTWKVINTGKILNVEDIQKDPDIGPAGRELGHHSALGIPIFLEKRAIGVMWFLSHKERKFNEKEANLLSTLGNQIAIAIAKTRMFEEIKQREADLNQGLGQLSKKNRYETIISTVTRSVHQSINLQDVLENAVETMKQNIDEADNISIYLVEREDAVSTGSPQAVLKAYRGYPEWFIKRVGRIPHPKGFTWKTIIEGKPRYCADVDQDTVIGPAGRELGTKSYASMPIRYQGKTVGTININSLQKNAFDEEELNLLGTVAQQIEIAIKNAKQAEALQKAKEELELRVYDRTKELIDINKELTREITERKRAEETLRKRTEQVLRYQRVLLKLAKMDNSDLDSALKKLTEADAKTLGVERVSVWHYSKDHSEIICKDLYKLSENIHESGLRLKTQDYPNYFRALEESRILAANDARFDPRTQEYTEGYLKPLGITSMMDVPVRVHGEVVGIIGHEHTGSMREWTVEEQDFAASIADMVSLALEASERKLAEEQIKASLKEKEVLLKEIHHRVKNNLQIIHSLLNLQSSRIDDLRTREKLKQSQNRIKSIALIHETLYQFKDFARIDFREYIKELSTHLFSSYGANSKDIKLSIEADNVYLSIDKAIPCSLIINEIVSNALKHGFLVKKKGKIRIALHSSSKANYGKDNSTPHLCHLIISNNGIKFPEDLDFRNTESVGLQLVCALTDQLKGTIELDTSSGTEFKITFPV
ncbi:MAG TPA: GAF domain-containing protein [Thermodesulfobacteriota bacterium]|nr:GAF domain-containing protein [Thermodesulfobacteriota bacterium]